MLNPLWLFFYFCNIFIYKIFTNLECFLYKITFKIWYRLILEFGYNVICKTKRNYGKCYIGSCFKIQSNLGLRTQFVPESCSKTESYFPTINNVKKINSFHAPKE